MRFHAAYAQSAWMPFLNHVMHELELEDIDGVYEDIDGAPVARIASLVDGGLYFARPTEVGNSVRTLTRLRHNDLSSSYSPSHTYVAWTSSA